MVYTLLHTYPQYGTANINKQHASQKQQSKVGCPW